MRRAGKAGASAPAVLTSMTAANRENPQRLSGDELRSLAHRRGIARSELERMSDDKIREQLRYVTYRQYEEAV